MSRAPVYALAFLALTGCTQSNSTLQPVFVDGRAVAHQGDTLLAMSLLDSALVVLRNRASGEVTRLGRGALEAPHHVQINGDGEVLVSDSRGGSPRIVVFGTDGTVRRTIESDTTGFVSHQFAALPDGRIVIERTDGNLYYLAEDGTEGIFAEVEDANPERTGLMVAALGGVWHAVPDRHITLYNGFGSVRWRVEWPWKETVHPADVAIDANGRLHLLGGIVTTNNFIVYSFDSVTGEIIRWSERGPSATFNVEKLGEIRPDSASRWLFQ